MMLIRIVKLTIKSENIASFERIFEETKQYIRDFDGCQFLALYRDNKEPNIFFTHSHWVDDAALQHYRNSEFFKTVWSKTKLLFDAKPEAYSMTQITTAK